MKSLEDIQVTNPYLKLPPLSYDFAKPSPLVKPFLIDYNRDLADLLGIDTSNSDTLLKLTNGELLLNGAKPFAMCYAGHQFGHFVPRLGDGRAINIGSVRGSDGVQYHMQLKGAGQTLYSRSGDGRAVLRSSIREYLISEAMHGLGVETTRALAIIASKHKVYRENWEMGAIVLRVSPSWVRFGTFEYFAHSKNITELKALADYVIEESYPHLKEEENKYLYMFLEVVGKSAKLMAKWQSIGFNHGVMNTDNMSIAGLTIDYGPFAFLDDYNSNYICNHTDYSGRYSFKNQPGIAEWNLKALAVALKPLVKESQLQSALEHYANIYTKEFLRLIGKKLGLYRVEAEDTKLMQHLFGTLQSLQVDYTLFFRRLSHYNGDRSALLKLGLYATPMNEWLESYDKRLAKNSLSQEQRHAQMLKTNPKYVLKNYILQEAIDNAQKEDFSTLKTLMQIAKDPYNEHPQFERWAGATPAEFKDLQLSCSS